MVKKQHVKSRNICKLTFELPAEFEADEVQLIADFNHWTAEPFEKLKNGKWRLIHEVEPGQQYQFRYIILENGEVRYVNDEAADGYVPNRFGSENAVVAC